jgi:hypothetical protein
MDDEAAPAQAEMEPFEAPLSALGGKEFKPGEEVMMKVVSINPENKTVMLTYSTGEGHEDKGMGDEHPAVAGMPGGEMES